jgi:hypothetical protein
VEPATNRVSWSSSLEVIHGLTPGTFGGRLEDFKRDIHPEDLECGLSSIRKTLVAALISMSPIASNARTVFCAGVEGSDTFYSMPPEG